MTQTKNGRLNNRGTRIQFREHAKEQKLDSPSRISTKFRHIVQYDFNWLIRNCVSWFRCIDSNMVFKVHLFLMMCSSPLKLNLFLKANIEFDDPQRVSFFSFGSVRFSDRIKSNRKHKFRWSDIDTQRLCTHLHIYVNTSETKIWQMGFFSLVRYCFVFLVGNSSWAYFMFKIYQVFKCFNTNGLWRILYVILAIYEIFFLFSSTWKVLKYVWYVDTRYRLLYKEKRCRNVIRYYE